MQCDPAPQCDAVFKLYDHDKTGRIDAREVRCHTSYMHVLFSFYFEFFRIFFNISNSNDDIFYLTLYTHLISL